MEEEKLIYQCEPDNGYAGEFATQDRLDGLNAYPTFFSMSTNALTRVVEVIRRLGRVQNVQAVQPLRSVQVPSFILPRDAGEQSIVEGR